jgi:chemotaxis protein MotB
MGKKHGHHGGAWKVAYADFVTAMMALFLVLWLTSQDAKIKEAVERAFTNPFASLTKSSPGIIESKAVPVTPARGLTSFTASAIELKWLRQLHQDLLKSLQQSESDNDSVKLDMNNDGLRVTVFDRNKKPIFEPGTTRFTEYGGWVFSTLAWQIARYKSFNVELEGHTEKGLAPIKQDYGPWELSLERANAARRKFLEHSVLPEQVKKVAAYADTQPLPGAKPEDEMNNRVTVLLRVSSAY